MRRTKLCLEAGTDIDAARMTNRHKTASLCFAKRHQVLLDTGLETPGRWLYHTSETKIAVFAEVRRFVLGQNFVSLEIEIARFETLLTQSLSSAILQQLKTADGRY